MKHHEAVSSPTPQPPRIVLTANSSWSLYRFRRYWIEQLLAAGYVVSVLAPRDDYTERLVALGVQYHHIPLDRCGINPLKDIRLCWHYVRALWRIRPTILMSYTIKPVIYASLAARLVAVPTIFAVITGLGYTFAGEDPKRRFVQAIGTRLYRLALRKVRRVFFLNEDHRRFFIERRLVAASQTRRLPGEGIDTEFFAPQTPSARADHFAVLMVARLLKDKGVEEFLEAAQVLRARYPRLRFQLLGPFDENPAAIRRETLQRFQDDGSIEYLGAVDDVRPYLAHSDLVVLPSYSEALPLALLEAMSMAKPIVTTDIPGCRELVCEGENGYLAQARSADSLASAIEKVYQLDPDLRRQMGEASRRVVLRQYRNEVVAQALLSEVSSAVSA